MCTFFLVVFSLAIGFIIGFSIMCAALIYGIVNEQIIIVDSKKPKGQK